MSIATVCYASAGIICVLFLYTMEKGREPQKMLRYITAIVLWIIAISSLWTI